MIVVIDGYNLIKQILGASRISHKQRDAFVQELAGYLKKRGLRGVIVFDGGESNFPYHVKKGTVEVIFSGYKETADDVILQYMEDHKSLQLILISSDRELRDYAHSLGKESIRAPEFYRRYVDKPVSIEGEGDATLYKLSSDAPAELDQLMMEASESLERKGEDREILSGRESASHKVSKKERRRARVFDKLK